MPIAVYALALMAFSIGTTELIVSGILPTISTDLAVSIPTAGLLVTGYAAGVAIGGPLLALLTARFPAKPTILVLSLIFAAGQLLCAIAPNYTLLMAARLVSACGHGVFFGVAAVTVSRLVPQDRRGAALSLFVGGITIANILGLPAGTAIGNAFGWRASFLCIAIMALLATLAIASTLPGTDTNAEPEAPLKLQAKQLGHQQVWSTYLVIILVMIGAISFGTFQVPLLLEITKVQPTYIPMFLLLGGAGSIIGIFLGGKLADWRVSEALIGVLITQVACSVCLLVSVHNATALGIGLFLSSAATLAFSTPVQMRVLNAAKAAPNLASTMIASAYNVGIAGGALLGAVLLQAGMNYAMMPVIGIITGIAATLVTAASWMASRRVAVAS
ncbi:MFS transporter [Devosia sp.]|uniref:MFS transporter n=1 Tax=Devosia sp. TaxID=1871048 RepID=UPI003262CE12